MNAATQWFKFDPSFVGTPMQGEWCLWSFVTKHGRESYSGRWIVHEGSDLIVTDRGWSVPLVVGEAYFARVIPLDKIPSASTLKESAEPPVPYDPEIQPFDIDEHYNKYFFPTGHRVVTAFSSRKIIKPGERIQFYGEPYLVRDRERKDGFIRYSLTPDSVPKVEYLGSTEHGVQLKISPPAQTMSEDAGEPSTFVQDRLADMIEPDNRDSRWTLCYSWPTLKTIDFKTPRPGDGPIPALVTIIAPDGQRFSWDVQGEIKDGVLLSPEITLDIWKEICDWQEAWVPAQ